MTSCTAHWPRGYTAHVKSPAHIKQFQELKTSTKSFASISRRSEEPLAPIPPLTPACSHISATCTQCCRNPGRGDTNRDDSHSTFLGAVARRAKAKASGGSR